MVDHPQSGSFDCNHPLTAHDLLVTSSNRNLDWHAYWYWSNTVKKMSASIIPMSKHCVLRWSNTIRNVYPCAVLSNKIQSEVKHHVEFIFVNQQDQLVNYQCDAVVRIKLGTYNFFEGDSVFLTPWEAINKNPFSIFRFHCFSDEFHSYLRRDNPTILYDV